MIAMLRYLLAIAALFVLGRWLLGARRRSRALSAPLGPDDVAEPGTLRTVALLTGPNFDEDEGDDPQSMGEPLARAIREGLIARGYSAEEPYNASHGFSFDVQRDGAAFAIGCGIRDADDDDSNVWLVFMTRTIMVQRELLPAENTANARKLALALHDIFGAMPGVKRVHWTAKDGDFDRGKEVWEDRPF